MEKLHELLYSAFNNGSFIKLVMSDLRNKKDAYKKATARPTILQGQLCYQIEYFSENKAIQENLTSEDCLERCIHLIENTFKQANLFTTENDFQILAQKPENPRITKKPPTKKLESLAHNREKTYLLPDGVPCEFLIRLGVMNKSGNVLQKHYAKFKQINRFLEIVSDIKDSIPTGGTIIDFGCGKAYLTFALHHYLNIILKKECTIIGLDLKSDVIDFCNEISCDLKFDNLSFELGNIAEFTAVKKADMVVTLHACDTATDFAIIKAVEWDASVILTVPCCQHELFNQIENNLHSAIFSHGILKERFSAILTDGLRALKLESLGYKIDMIEFTSLEHTSKNIMIRGIKTKKPNKNSYKAYSELKEYWHVNPTIDSL